MKKTIMTAMIIAFLTGCGDNNDGTVNNFSVDGNSTVSVDTVQDGNIENDTVNNNQTIDIDSETSQDDIVVADNRIDLWDYMVGNSEKIVDAYAMVDGEIVTSLVGYSTRIETRNENTATVKDTRLDSTKIYNKNESTISIGDYEQDRYLNSLEQRQQLSDECYFDKVMDINIDSLGYKYDDTILIVCEYGDSKSYTNYVKYYGFVHQLYESENGQSYYFTRD